MPCVAIGCAGESGRRRVNEIPPHSRRLVDGLLQAYCARVCPPEARHVVAIGYALERDRATLHELRRICGVPGTARPVPLAQFRYSARGGEWQLLVADEDGRFRRYARLPGSRSFVELLREVDADPVGLVWGRIDGSSLRWCSARGRCDGCDLKYREVLGVRGLGVATGMPQSSRGSSGVTNIS
jgi:hypothetical protein